MKYREKTIGTIPFAAAERKPLKLSADGLVGYIKAVLKGKIDIAAGGGASGTVRNNPGLSPINAISGIDLVRNPESPIGPLAANFPLQLWHLLLYIFEPGRVPKRTALSAGDVAADVALYVQFLFPLSLLKFLETLQPTKKLTTFEMGVKWPDSLDALRDALLTSSTRAVTIDTGDPLRVEVIQLDVLDAPAEFLDPKYEIGWRYDRLNHENTGENVKKLSVRPGERCLAVFAQSYDNTVRANFATGATGRIQFRYGTREPEIDMTGDELQVKNAADYKTVDGSWPTGFYVADLMAHGRRGVAGVPVIPDEGSIPQFVVNSGAVAPTASSFTEILTMVLRDR